MKGAVSGAPGAAQPGGFGFGFVLILVCRCVRVRGSLSLLSPSLSRRSALGRPPKQTHDIPLSPPPLTRLHRDDPRDWHPLLPRPLLEEPRVDPQRLDERRHRLDRVDDARVPEDRRRDARKRADVGAEVEDDVACRRGLGREKEGVWGWWWWWWVFCISRCGPRCCACGWAWGATRAAFSTTLSRSLSHPMYLLSLTLLELHAKLSKVNLLRLVRVRLSLRVGRAGRVQREAPERIERLQRVRDLWLGSLLRRHDLNGAAWVV